MKFNSTIGLTLLLLTSMLAAGIFSALAGMSVGREALKGITQPDTRPTNNLANRKGEVARNNQLVMLQEDKILAAVKARMGGKATSPVQKVAAAPSPTASKFPIQAASEGVVLEVKSVQTQGDALVLSVSLKNETQEPVKFLYSFLEVKDDQGQVLSANTEGLPSELPADESPYAGTVRIPVTAVNRAKTLSLALSDYPDQQVQLKLSNIPVTR
jgi:hypothetical protein